MSSLSERLDDLPLAEGGVAGVAAFVAGYLVTYLLKLGDVAAAKARSASDGGLFVATHESSTIPAEDVFGEELVISAQESGVQWTLNVFGVDPPGDATMVAWLYEGAHGLDPSGRLVVETGSESATYALSLAVPVETHLLLVPPVVLTAAGYAVVSQVGAPEEMQRAGRLGGTVAVGYALASLAAIALFRWSQTGAVLNASGSSSTALSYGPNPLVALAVMGVAYPLVFGALGGYVAFRRASTDAPSFDDTDRL